MKNADMAAMPTQSNGGDIFGGLTKREMVAMHAPEVPDWFDGQWRKEFEGNEMYFREEEDEWGSTYLQITKHGVKAMYFAWRVTYADELLAELERTCQK